MGLIQQVQQLVVLLVGDDTLHRVPVDYVIRFASAAHCEPHMMLISLGCYAPADEACGTVRTPAVLLSLSGICSRYM